MRQAVSSTTPAQQRNSEQYYTRLHSYNQTHPVTVCQAPHSIIKRFSSYAKLLAAIPSRYIPVREVLVKKAFTSSYWSGIGSAVDLVEMLVSQS